MNEIFGDHAVVAIGRQFVVETRGKNATLRKGKIVGVGREGLYFMNQLVDIMPIAALLSKADCLRT